MVKEHFVEDHGVPLYTVGVGGSGGAIQQYVYAQNHPGLHRCRHPAVLVLRHDHADDPRRRLRAAGALLRRHRPAEPEVEGRPRPARHPGPQCQRDARDRRRRGVRHVESALFVLHRARAEPARADPDHADHAAAPHRVPARVVRADAAHDEPDVHERAGPRQARAGSGGRRLDPRRRPREHLRHGRGGLRPHGLGQRRRPVRPRSADGRRHHAGRVPRPEREGRELEGARRHGRRGIPVRRRRRAPRPSTRGARAT